MLTRITTTGLALLLCSAVGCGVSGGEALFMSGLVPLPIVKPEFVLTEGPVAVLVDDYEELAYWSEAKSMLADRIVDELSRNNAAKLLISNAKVDRLRKADPKFEQKSCRQLGRKLGAEQIVWLQVREFYASEQALEVHAAARISVVAKVFNVLEEDRRKVRLWPDERTGAIISAELNAHEVTAAKTREGICRLLTEKLADLVAKKFYQYRREAFDPS